MGFNYLIIGGLLVAFGISLCLPARKARKNDQIREAWPTAKGTVMSTEVLAQPPLVTKQGKQINQYDVAVKYQFRSGGQLHFGSNVSYPRFLYSKEEADQLD